MTVRLPDGAVIPSHVKVANSAERSSPVHEQMFGNLAMREGLVVARHLPGEPGYENEPHALYDVVCFQVDGFGAEGHHRYKNCKLGVASGSAADQFHQSVRCPAMFKDVVTPEIMEESSRVLVQCINGRSDQAVIVGFLQHQYTGTDSRDNGHHRYELFNGVEFSVNKEGEYTIRQTGATIDFESNAVAEAKNNTYVKFTQEGNVVVTNDDGETITVDKASKQVHIEAREMNTITDTKWTVKAGTQVVVNAPSIVIQGDNVTYIGQEGATENLVLGVQLVTALQELVGIIAESPIFGRLGKPNGRRVVLDLMVQAKLAAWKAKWTATPGASPMLSTNKFTE